MLSSFNEDLSQKTLICSTSGHFFIKKGEVLGFETDTVWWLGCLPDDELAADKIYEIKGRDRTKPLILMSNNIESLLRYTSYVPEYAKILMDKYFPGALTLIFKKNTRVKDFVTSGKDTVGIRVPAHSGFSILCEKIAGNVLATTSLNYSNEPPVPSYEEACEKFGKLATVINPKTLQNFESGEKTKNALAANSPLITGVSSTVVLCTGDEPVVLRQGDVYI